MNRALRAAPLAALLLLSLAARRAFPQAPPAVETRLSWDQCAGDGYIGDHSFACDVNTGEETIVASVIFRDGPRTNVAGLVGFIDVTLTSPTLPSWWLVKTGECRSGAVTVVTDALGDSPGCLAWAGTTPVVAVYDIARGGFYDPNQMVIQVATVVPAGSEVALGANTEYQLFRVRITHAKSAGAGACAGCAVPACIGFGQLELAMLGGDTETFAGAGLDAVTWQGAYVSAYPTRLHDPPTPGLHDNFLQCTLPPVPARNRTWGTIKSLYR